MSKVYVLGAGASRALNSGAPLMPELLKIGLGFGSEDRSGPAYNAAQAVSRFIHDFYAVDPTFTIPPFEDVLSQVDYCIVNNVPLSQEYSVEHLRVMRKHLTYVLGRTIQVKVENQTNRDLVNQFLQSLYWQTDSIISLNYDLIIDNALQDVNYCIPFRGDIPHQTQVGVALCKLHGSLNWLYCPVCRELELTDHRKGALLPLIEDQRCRKCNTPFEPVIITPSFLKDYNNVFIVQLWREAQQRLHNAKEIVFVAYSLPDADIVLRMFFTRALYTNRLRNGDRGEYKIRVVDWVKATRRARPSEVCRRYEKLFGEIDYDNTGFEDYIKRGCQTVKQFEGFW